MKALKALQSFLLNCYSLRSLPCIPLILAGHQFAWGPSKPFETSWHSVINFTHRKYKCPVSNPGCTIYRLLQLASHIHDFPGSEENINTIVDPQIMACMSSFPKVNLTLRWRHSYYGSKRQWLMLLHVLPCDYSPIHLKKKLNCGRIHII